VDREKAAIFAAFRASVASRAAGLLSRSSKRDWPPEFGFSGIAAPHCGHIPPRSLRDRVGTSQHGVSDSVI
jgi:hypothetical protein